MLRILSSSFAISASAVNEDLNADITQADLEGAVPVGGSILPVAFVFDPEDANITLKRLVVANTKNDEGKLAIIPLGSALTLAAVNKMTSPQAGGVDAPRLTVAHGARLEGRFDNASASPVTISVLWKVENAPIRIGPQSIPAEVFGRAGDPRPFLLASSTAPAVLPTGITGLSGPIGTP